MLAEINRYLEMPIDEKSEDVHIRAYLQPIAGTWKFDAQVTRGPTSRREVDFGSDCWVLTARMAWVIAIDLEPLGSWGMPVAPDPYRREDPEPTSEPLVSSPPPPREPSVVPPTEDQIEEAPTLRKRGMRVEGVIGLAGGTNFNVLPPVVGGAELRGGIQIGWARILALANYWGGGLYLSEDRRVGAELSAWDLGVEGCGAPLRRTIELHLCLSVAAGGVRARGLGDLESPKDTHRAWLYTGLRFQAAWVVQPRVALFASAGASLTTLRPRFMFDLPQTLEFEVPWVGASALAGVELRFGSRRRR